MDIEKMTERVAKLQNDQYDLVRGFRILREAIRRVDSEGLYVEGEDEDIIEALNKALYALEKRVEARGERLCYEEDVLNEAVRQAGLNRQAG